MNDPIQEAWDRFAAAALPALIGQIGVMINPENNKPVSVELVAGWSCDYADAMLRERKARAERRGMSK